MRTEGGVICINKDRNILIPVIALKCTFKYQLWNLFSCNSFLIYAFSFFLLKVVLETEITNKSALKLYENLGFVRDKRLFRYYLNGVDALRLKLWLR